MATFGCVTVKPTLDHTDMRAHLGGFVGERLQGNLEGWLLPVAQANPAMLQIFRSRDRRPRPPLVPWAGEFAGKVLISGAQTLHLSDDPRLRERLHNLVQELVSVQDADGYLGPHPLAERLTGRTHDGKRPLWDVWGHYHCMLGLLLWHRETGDMAALDACLRAADCLCAKFLDAPQALCAAQAEEMNMAVAHIFCLLYEWTGEERFLRMVRTVEAAWEVAPAGDYVRQALAGVEFWQTPKPRWESLHDIQAIAELYWITGNSRYRAAFEQIWWSILRGDRHCTGGFTSGEKAVGNPYDPRAIETCCTIAWIALSVDMLRMTGDARVADEIELSTLNGFLGAQHPSGRWYTYNTPMDGQRRASQHDIVFQSLAGSPEINCCSANAGRGFGMISDWAVMRAADGLTLNYYGPSTITAPLPSGQIAALHQQTAYPRDGQVTITLGLAHAARFALSLRVPVWSARTTVAVNQEPPVSVSPGRYYVLTREWRDGDSIRLELDMSPHFWLGEREAAGQAALYSGPLLLAYDQRFNPFDADGLPALRLADLRPEPLAERQWPEPWLLRRVTGEDGRALTLCDFATAGALGTHYRSWLPIQGLAPQPPSNELPLWARRESRGG